MLVSTRPLNLQKFVDDTRAISTTAQGDIGRLRASWDAFAAAANDFGPTDTGLLAEGPGGVLGQRLDRWQRQETYVDLVRSSFEAADRNAACQHGHGWPVVTIGDWRFDWYLQDQARQQRIDLSKLLSDPGSIRVPDPLRATPIPHDSGFVEDPVCTATGHFVDTALDLAMPQRLQMLAWPRVYSSSHSVHGGHGRGWGSWASVACVRQADGSLAYTGPDGQRLRLRPARGGADGWRRTTWLRATATPIPSPREPGDGGDQGQGGVPSGDDGGPVNGGVPSGDASDPADGDLHDGGALTGVELRWDQQSPHPDETWVFRADGTLVEVRSPDHGTTAAAYDDGRLVRLTHEGGRHLEVHWEGDRIDRVASSCGRAVEYRYDQQGDLVEVVSARAPRRYDLAPDGRIVAVWDADGVRLCHNSYDHRGRVLRQLSPFGRTTTFSYDGLVTVVGDTDGGPESRWEHDRQGRLVGLVDAEGHRMTRSFDGEGRCLSVTGFDGTTVTYGYDPAGRMTSRRDARGEERFLRDDHGRVVRHERPGGAWTAYEYHDGGGSLPRRAHGPEGWELVVDHADGVVRRITDADGVTLAIESDDAGCPTAVTDGLGRTTTLAVHPSGEVSAVTLADGTTWVVDRNDAGRATGVTLPDGGRTEIHWTPGGRLSEVVGLGGARTRYRHGPHGEVTAVTDPRGRTVQLAYDRLQRLVGLASGERRWALDHTALGLVEAVHDPAGHTWRLDHDAEGRTTALTDPLGHCHAYDYDPIGELVRQVDPAGGITHHVRDDAGRVVAVVDPEGGATRISHDLLGRVTRVESPDGGVVERRYTAAGRLAEEVTGEGRGHRLRYDAAGRVTEEVDGSGATTTYHRDAVGRIVGVTGHDGRTQRFTHDAAGRVIAAEVGGSVWRTTYDLDGRITAMVDPLGATTRFAYDAAGNLLAATDPLGHTTTYQWDDQGLCSAVTDSLGHTTRYRWDGRGLCVAAIDALDQVTTFHHDEAGRPAGVEPPDGRLVEHVLDAVGRLVELHVDGRPELTQAFDRCGRPVQVHEPDRGRTHRLTWSPSGRLLALTTSTGASGNADRHAADAYGRGRGLEPAERTPMGVDGGPGADTGTGTDANANADADAEAGTARRGHRLDSAEAVPAGRDQAHGWRWRYDGDGLVVAATAAEGSTTTRSYDGAGRLVEQVGDHVRVRLERDGAGRVVVLDAAGLGIAGPPAGGLRRELRYDGGGHLVRQTDRWDGAVTVVDYERDATGRIVAVRSGGGGSTYAYDAAGQLVLACHGAEGGRGWAFRYDAGGRLVAEHGPDGRVRHYRYDPLHRLVAVTPPRSVPRPSPPRETSRAQNLWGAGAGAWVVTFGHDPLGRRTHRTDAGGTTRYGWDPLGRLAWIERDSGERRQLDVDAFGSLVAVNGTPLAWDPNGPVPELRSIGDRAVIAAAGTTLGLTGPPDDPAVTWLTGDWRGSARPTDPWGVPLGPVRPVEDPLRASDGSPAPLAGTPRAGAGVGSAGPAPGFLGELEVDGLVWLRNRAYDPASRQFLSPDPLPGHPGSPVLAHPYHYAANDPIGQADPLGLAPMSIDAYKQHRKVTTGVQWKNIVFAAEVALSVGLMFTPLGPANAARMFAMAGPRIALSSGTKMAGMAVNGSLQTAVWELAGQRLDEELPWAEVRWGTVGKGAAFGGIGTMFGGAVGPQLGSKVVSPVLTKVMHIPGKPATVASSLTTSSVLLGTTSAGYETYDLTNLPGSDGVFKATNVVASTVSAVPYTVAGGFVVPVRPVR